MRVGSHRPFLIAIGLLLLVEAASAGRITGSNDDREEIPENVAAGLNRSINIAEHGRFSELLISVRVNHSWVGDLVYTLSHNGTAVKLLDRPGVIPFFRDFGDNSNFSQNRSIFFSDAFTVSAATIGEGCDTGKTVGSGDYTRPDSARCANPDYRPIEALSAFTGDVFGTWTLSVSDNARTYDGSYPAQFWSWSLQATLAEPVPEPGSLALVGLALAGSFAARQRKRDRVEDSAHN